MTNLTTVGLTNGAGSSGTGSVSTLDNVFQVGTPIAVKAASTPAVATDPALVVTLSPNNVNPNGQTTMNNSAPVVIASNQTVVPVSIGANTTGGLSVISYILANSTNANNVKASAGQLYKVEAFNNSGNIAYIKIYNTASTPTAGSGTPVARVMIPGNSSGGAGVISTTDVGTVYSSGIGFTVTGAIADADTTTVAASSFLVNFYYK